MLYLVANLLHITQQIFNIFFKGRFIQENKSTKNFLTKSKTIYNYIHVINKKNKNRYTRFLAEYQCGFEYVALFHMLFVKFIFEQFLIHGITIFIMIVTNYTS